MQLEELKDYFRDLSLRHKDVKQFSVGSWYDAANNSDDKYPLVWWEMPYVITYSDGLTKRLDSVTISFSVFLYTKQDDIPDSHNAISIAKEIGDAIIVKANKDATEFKINFVNSISVREHSDDYVAGMRYDLNISLTREICEPTVDDLFA